jgi:hypothetical protein
MNRSSQLLSAWTGVAILVLFLLGGVVMSRWFPVPRAMTPGASGEEIQAWLARDGTWIKIGLTLMMASMACCAPWGAGIAAQTRRSEGRFPVLTYMQLTTLSVSCCLATAAMALWGAGAFRVTTDPAILRLTVDLGWHLFLFAWVPFAFWAAATGLAILWVPRDLAVYPRWLGFLGIWTGLLYAPGVFMIFFHSGALGYHGLIAMWLPLVVFFIWILAFVVVTFINIHRGAHDTWDPESRSFSTEHEFVPGLLLPSAAELPSTNGHAPVPDVVASTRPTASV